MIKKETIPVPPFKGLFLDGVTVPGGLSKAENIVLLADGTAERRSYERTLTNTEACEASRGPKELFELRKNDATRYIYCDIDNTAGVITSFGAELVAGSSAITAWTDVDDWALSTTTWVHDGSGVTALVGKPAVVATTKYRVVVGVTCASTSTDGNWAYTSIDSGTTWTNWGGAVYTVWLNKWTHTAGLTTALSALADFTPVAGASYSITIYVTQTSATGTLSVYLGGKLAGTISAIGAASHTFIVRFATDATALRFVPTTDWAGSIDKAWPGVPISGVVYWASVKKFIDPAGPDEPSNWDTTAGPHYPWYGYEMLNVQPSNWYTEVDANVSQGVAITLGGAACGTVTASGEYTYTVTAATTAGLTFTPTTAWGGTITKASVMAVTETESSKTKVIGGVVTGEAELEVAWIDILTGLTSGDSVRPQWTQLQDRAFRVDGTNSNYWFQDSSDYHYLGCPAPAAIPVVASTTGGSILPDDYNVAYTYVKKYDSYVVEGNPSPAAYITIAGTAITVGVIASTEKDITHIRIYRTLKDESGSDYYFDQEIPNATRTVTLKNSDDDIGDGEVLESDHDMPPKGKYILGGGSRLWLVDTSGTLHWSRLDEPELMPAVNYMTFDPKDGDRVMGLCPLRKHILVFKRRKTWLLDMFSESISDDGYAALSKDVVSSNIGCIATGSIQAVGTDSAIWLSHAGFVLYNGGTIKNISAGDAATGTPSRIQSVINNFIAAGAENFIDSVYHTAKQLYHVNFITRSAEGDEITEQRHFVYSMVTDTWTEYAYYNTAGVKQYEINFAYAHDSLDREVILIAFLTTSTGEVMYVYQTEYDVLVTRHGDGNLGDATASPPLYMFPDTLGNVYAIDTDGLITKTTSAGVKSTIATSANVHTAHETGYTSSWITGDFMISHALYDSANACIYLKVWGVEGPPETPGTNIRVSVIRVTLEGVITLIKAFDQYEFTFPNYEEMTDDAQYQQIELGDMILDSTGANMFVFDRGTLYKIATPAGTPVVSTYYTFTGYEATMVCYGMGLCGNNLYIHYIPTAAVFDGYEWADAPAGTETQRIGKFTDITGTASFSSWEIGTEKTYASGMLVYSDTEIYLYGLYNDAGLSGWHTIYKMTFSADAWTSAAVDAPKVAHGDCTSDRVHYNPNGYFVYASLHDSDYDDILTGDSIVICNTDWDIVDSITIGSYEDSHFLGATVIDPDARAIYGVVYTPGV